MATMQQPAMAPAGNPQEVGEARRKSEQDRQQRARKKQALEMQKENILSQRTSNSSRRAALEQALSQIEAELAEL